jgi:hypothetical protein
MRSLTLLSRLFAFAVILGPLQGASAQQVQSAPTSTKASGPGS